MEEKLFMKLRSQYQLHERMKFSVKDFFSKCDQIRRKLRIWSHRPKKSLIENFIFCAVLSLNFISLWRVSLINFRTKYVITTLGGWRRGGAITYYVLRGYRISKFMNCYLLLLFLFNHRLKKVISYSRNQLKICNFKNLHLGSCTKSAQFVSCYSPYEHMSSPNYSHFSSLQLQRKKVKIKKTGNIKLSLFFTVC